MCSLFENGRNAAIAEQLRQALGGPGLAETDDPLAVLALAYEHGTVELAEDTLIAGEVAAAAVARPTPGGHETIAACHGNGWPVVIVSNNSRASVEAYLARHELDELVHGIVGRAYGRPDLMKPDPAPIRRALAMAGIPPESCVLVGDSVTDMTVSVLTNVHPIGYATRPSIRGELLGAGAAKVVEDMRILADAVRAVYR